MEKRMNPQLVNKIASFDISQPYVWRLRLSEADFKELETCLKAVVSTDGVNALSKAENAIVTIIYMAEWYKRRYQSGNKNMLTDGLDLETLWENSGISQKNFLYKDESGNKRWLYSIYVLGGLAIQHELHRNDSMRFLKGLCRIYHGENYTLENLDDAARAVAFRESIKRQQSLYEYMKEILNGEMPFHQDDLTNEKSDVNRFVSTVKAANDEILKVKFRFEWSVNFSPEYTFMSRKLIIWMKPEEVGGGLHQYLRFDRVHLWGVPNPESKEHLYIYIRFMNGDEIVEPSTMDKPIITYLNHDVNDFVAFGPDRFVQVKQIPTSNFDKIEILVKDDDGNEYIAQTQATSEYMQLWREEDYGDTWTSTQNAQKQTALLFSNRCHLKDETITNDVYRRSFRDQKLGISETWNWIYIYDSVTFADEKGKEITLYNRIGYDQVTTRLYTDTIHYIDGGKVKHYYLDDPDYSDDFIYDTFPLIFGAEDIIVRHFATKDDIRNAQPEGDTIAELIEFKQGNGFYAPWTEDNKPSYGAVTLRVTIKGKPYPFSAIYLPRLLRGTPILRDFDATCIRYKAVSDEEAVKQDHIPMDGNMLAPTLPIKFGEGESYYELDVYRPTLIKEVILDGQIIEYLQDGQQLELPYIFKNRVQLNDFSRQGYQAYECKNLGNIYTETYLNIAKNPSVGMAALAVWNAEIKYQGKLLDAMAPDCLLVCFGQSKKESNWEGQEALVWNYDKVKEPMVASPSDVPDFGIIFQNLSKNKDLTCNYPIQVDDDPWGLADVGYSIIRCFEVANETGTYFFLMKPLMDDLSKSNIIKELYEPLLEARSGELTEKDKQGLIRIGEEFGFDWQTNNIYIDNE